MSRYSLDFPDGVEDLSDVWAKIQIYFRLHWYSWQHPRLVQYLNYCKASSRHKLTPKQLKNLADKLEALPELRSADWLRVRAGFEGLGLHWQHPRALEYLRRCGVDDHHALTDKQVKNLADKLERELKELAEEREGIF